jgi:PBP1b-binding outer membrane lipoprotein LpoB
MQIISDYFLKHKRQFMLLASSLFLIGCVNKSAPPLQNAAPFDQPKTLQYEFHIPLGFAAKN